MDNDTAMAAAVAQPRTHQPPRAAARSRRGFFTFLKDGVLVTTRNRGLFLRLDALHAARLLALLAARIVALRYMGPTLGLSANGEDGYPFRFSVLFDKILDGHSWLLPAGAACLVVKVAIKVLGLAINAATSCAAVASCSAASIDGGGPGRTTLTLASLLGNVRRNLRGLMATAVFVMVVWWAFVVEWMLVTPSVLDAVEAYAGRTLAELFLLLNAIAMPLVFICYSPACEVAAVVSVAEPGLRAGGALRRARRLTRGTKKVAQATLHALLSWALNKAVWRTYYVAIARVPDSTAAADSPFWLGAAVVLYMLVGAVEVLYTATVTAYYFDCKRAEEETAGHIHVE